MGEDKNLNIFKERVIDKYQPERIILFGSRARGDSFKDSDIDILIISDRFSGVPFRKRMIEMQYLWDGKELLEAFCYTPQEFEKKKKGNVMIQKAIEEGIELT